MKSLAGWLLFLWVAVLIESRPALAGIPSSITGGSVIVPAAIGCIFWFRSGRGILLAGAALLLHWLLTDQVFPIAAILVCVLSAWCLHTEPAIDDLFRRRWTWRQWVQPFVIATLTAAAMLIPLWSQEANPATSLARTLTISLPWMLVVVCVLRIRSEFDTRRT
jgi:UDP-N-acetylmuramyl pentapeptide phosphotransferase/UDP-N-acetylglucosamine-1-phosphate transferase